MDQTLQTAAIWTLLIGAYLAILVIAFAVIPSFGTRDHQPRPSLRYVLALALDNHMMPAPQFWLAGWWHGWRYHRARAH